jgi:hypothetical protein
MKKTILALLLIFIGCQDKKDEESGPFVGTWKLIEMGKYEVSGKCSGEVDDEEYRGLKSKGFTLLMELKKDGTGVETRTGPDAGTESFTWTQLGETLCIKNSCASFDLAANEQTFRINNKEDPYCQDEDYNITSDTNKRACESSSTSNEWFPEVCTTKRYRKEL